MAGNRSIKPEAVANAVKLTRALTDKQGIPVSRVLRHDHVTGKRCPALGAGGKSREVYPEAPGKGEADLRRKEVRKRLGEALAEQKQPVWNTLEEVPDWERPTERKRLDHKALVGTETGFRITCDLLRVPVINDWLGPYGR